MEIIKSKIFMRFNFITKHVHKNEHGFVIKLKRVKILNFVTCAFIILYTKISISPLVFSPDPFRISLLKGAATDMRYFVRSKFSRSLVHKKNFSLL